MQIDAQNEASLVYDRHDNLVFSFAVENRTKVRLNQVSSAMVAAVLSAEDQYFFEHAGMDFFALARAAWVDLKARALKQGGSTITQQLVRQAALTPDRTLGRKAREALLALRVDRRFDKHEILEAYLNRIYLGDGHYGVEAAARGYFGKKAAALNLSEAATLAGIIKCPSTCSPRASLQMATTHRDAVLRAMLGNGSITKDDYDSAAASAIALTEERHDAYAPQHDEAHHHEEGARPCALYFIEAVRQQVMRQFGAEEVLRGGLRIYTTIDMTLQREAEAAIAHRLEQLNASKSTARKSGRPAPPLEGALVALNPKTGEVLALVGGRDFHATPFNRATQAKRQPGSAFKPLFFAAALEQGYAPSSLVPALDTPIATPQGPWLPSGEHEAQSYTLRQALTVSSNRAAVRLMQLIGIGTAQRYARRLGIHSPMPAVPSLALGTAEVSLIELTSAYGAFAHHGIVAPPTLITRIEDRSGHVIWQASDNRHPYRAVRPGTAFLMSSMLSDVMNRGTGARARREGFKLPAAGKTGTTDDYGDAWFVGYTPSLAAGVWFGYDEKRTIMNRGFAATVALPAWARFMKKATARDKAEWFQQPADVERVRICRTTGLRAAEGCRLWRTDDGQSNVYEDYYLVGTAPYDRCSGEHQPPAPVDDTWVGADPTTVLSGGSSLSRP
jgi:penicillin-binding protein 1A